MLEQLQRKLKGLIRQSRQDELFALLLEDCLISTRTIFNDFTQLESRLNDAERDFGLNLINASGLRSEKDKINHALLGFIDDIGLDDLTPAYRKVAEQVVAISDYQAFTCDRTEQNGEVLKRYFLNAEAKIHHFFLYGDARQATKSLFERFHRYFGGTLDSWGDPDAQPSVRVKVIECEPLRSGDAIVYQADFMIKIIGCCQAPSLLPKMKTCTLNDLVRNSKLLKDFEPHDFVFVLLTVNDQNWTNEIPKVVDKLLDGFCNCELDASAPNFFFFYGIEYDTNKADVKLAVKRAVEEHSDRIIPLPELQRVKDLDVNDWFSRYERLIPKDKNVHQMSAWLFGEKTEFDMIDVQDKLLEIIKKNNRGMPLEN